MQPLQLLQELLRARTVNPPGDEKIAADILATELERAGLQVTIEQSPGGRASVIGRVPGPTDQPALVLLSHLDVVPVEEDQWSRDPFGGEIHDSCVWGRGALDMKSITVMHAAAAAALVASGASPAREVIVAAVADEEAGGTHGARWLVEEKPELVGLGEGRPAPEVIGEGGYGLRGLLDHPVLPIVLGEKTAVWLRLIAHGDPGHGAIPPRNQAAANLAWAIDKVTGYRDVRIHPVLRRQFGKLAAGSGRGRRALMKALASPAGGTLIAPVKSRLGALGAIGAAMADTVTLTQLDAGYKHNVVPATAVAALDCRLLPDTDPDGFVEKLRTTVSKRGVEVEAPTSYTAGPVSEEGPLFPVLETLSKDLSSDVVVVPSLTPAITDIRFFRARGAIGYGWVPLILDQELLGTIHGHDERVPIDGFERSVELMTEVVRRAAT